MFLTKMPIHTRKRGAVKLLSSPQAMHAAVQSAFPPRALEDAGGRTLWRIDRATNAETTLYLVSPVAPDLTHLVEQAGWQTGDSWRTRDYRNLLNRLAVGQVWAFRLTANPTFNGYKTGANWADTKPLAHVTAKQQEHWLLSRAERAGFRVPDQSHDVTSIRVTNRSTLRFTKGGHRVVIGTATFDGVLEVRDIDALSHTLTDGIGRAKAYGCGLLTLAPLTVVNEAKSTNTWFRGEQVCSPRLRG
ncbi:CRISPR-associated protein, Cse3 family (plasmid) [Mycobacterium sp. JS623]|uniref:type I-E CRISPR-associated protein Cas6/Cse3/CasE n=1 Tax=Mycobacterium sp. JS623 TaxID=212767 RepID=UPI0002A563AD|nr:type I-E CRISPR-associated protein Cas6/Cse3/CasE [Mycobacterium sp. JS623]AGB27114.1 CRISPR-associated protein, Cse3 family [Mycobacterium sp. JS623]